MYTKLKNVALWAIFNMTVPSGNYQNPSLDAWLGIPKHATPPPPRPRPLSFLLHTQLKVVVLEVAFPWKQLNVVVLEVAFPWKLSFCKKPMTLIDYFQRYWWSTNPYNLINQNCILSYNFKAIFQPNLMTQFYKKTFPNLILGTFLTIFDSFLPKRIFSKKI